MICDKKYKKEVFKLPKKKKYETFKCTSCGRELRLDTNFYQSASPLYKVTGRLSVCIDCVVDIYEEYLQIYKDEKKAVYYTCRKLDVPYRESDFGAAKNDNRKFHLFRKYMMKLNSLGTVNNGKLTFDSSDYLDIEEKNNSNKKSKTQIDENSSEIDFEELSKEIEFTDEDIEVKKDVINLLGYDPFAGYSKFDQKFLYGELLPYLDEDTLEDQYKLSQIIQIINNNNQIRKIDILIDKITSNLNSLMENQDKLKSLAAIKKDIVTNNDKLARENGISEKNKKGKSNNKSTLTGLMKYLRDLEFDDAEVDYYDQLKAYGMQRAANISLKAIAEQIKFDENDMNDIIAMQRDLIKSQENKILDLEEENRQYYKKLKEHGLI
jgi:hypothetical protein